MNEMVERAALAIMDCAAADAISPSACRVIARAALAATREPSEGMVNAVCKLQLDRLKRRLKDDTDAKGHIEGVKETLRVAHDAMMEGE